MGVNTQNERTVAALKVLHKWQQMGSGWIWNEEIIGNSGGCTEETLRTVDFLDHQQRSMKELILKG